MLPRKLHESPVDGVCATCPLCGSLAMLEPARLQASAVTWPCRCGYTVTVRKATGVLIRQTKTPRTRKAA